MALILRFFLCVKIIIKGLKMEIHNLLNILLKMKKAVGWRWPSRYEALEISSATHAVYGVRNGYSETHLFSLDLPRHKLDVRLAIKNSGLNHVTREQFEAAVAAL